MAEKDEKYLNSSEPFRTAQLLGGAYATVDTPAIVGFCHHADHKGIVTVTIMNEHDCIAKGCHYFEKFEEYPFWKRYRHKQELKQLFAEKKERRKEDEKRHLENLQKQEVSRIETAYRFAEKLGIANIEIISIRKTGEEFTIFYISDSPTNDWYDFRGIAFAMNKHYRKKFTLKHAKNPDGTYATISYSNKKDSNL